MIECGGFGDAPVQRDDGVHFDPAEIKLNFAIIVITEYAIHGRITAGCDIVWVVAAVGICCQRRVCGARFSFANFAIELVRVPVSAAYVQHGFVRLHHLIEHQIHVSPIGVHVRSCDDGFQRNGLDVVGGHMHAHISLGAGLDIFHFLQYQHDTHHEPVILFQLRKLLVRVLSSLSCLSVSVQCHVMGPTVLVHDGGIHFVVERGKLGFVEVGVESEHMAIIDVRYPCP
mmetsp:Transcript_24074/g.59031  ORF Transcript_24074/g.59031 Transcript_24074/m.59031 type:complete len:229 (-) Transcript_24074:387-1073(-)